MSNWPANSPADRELLRASALLLATGAGLVTLSLTIIRTPENPVELIAFYDEIRRLGTGIWIMGHLAVGTGVLLITGGFILFGLVFAAGRGLILARLGVISAVIGAVAVIAGISLQGVVLGQVIDQIFDGGSPDVDALITLGMIIWWAGRGLYLIGLLLFFGLTYLLFGLSVTTHQSFPPRIGYVAVASGAATMVLAMALTLEPPVPPFEPPLHAMLIIVSMLWTIGIALHLWQSAAGLSE